MLNTFNIEIAYEGMSILNTHDTVQALKIAMNKEADLYKNGTLIFSAMGLTQERNAELIAEHGIEMYLTPNNEYTFRYVNGNKNTELYAALIEYKSKEERFLEVQYRDYNYGDAVQFDNYDQMIEWLNLVYGDYKPENIKIACYIKGDKNYTISESLKEINERKTVTTLNI